MGDHDLARNSEKELKDVSHSNGNSDDKYNNGVHFGAEEKRHSSGSPVAVGDACRDGDDEGSGPCGWGKFQFACCQMFRNAKWFLVVLTLCGACQGMAVNGFVHSVISTVERRFELSSTESGLIASCYDIMFVVLVIPVSYFGGHGHKPRYLGIGIFVLGVGSFVFTLPHFVTSKYLVEDAGGLLCELDSNRTTECNSGSSSSLSNYKYLFYLGQLLHGAGATPLYTLGATYIDENVSQRSSAFCNGIFYTGSIVGPALGYILGARFLEMYTDIGVDPKSLGLDTNNPKWVGAWWIGFLISGTMAVLLSLPLLAFPQRLPGYKKYTAERGKETHVGSVNIDATGQHRGFMDILLSIKYLVTNVPFMLINLAAAADGILLSGFATFVPKFIEYKYGLSSATAALYVGFAAVPAGGGGTFLGGLIVRCFALKVGGILRFCCVTSFLLCTLGASLLMECDTAPFAGITLPYGQTTVEAASFFGKNLVDTCNQNCSCTEESYFPICGRDKVMYFSPCFAGCETTSLDTQQKRYENCSCINYNITTSDYSDGNVYVGEFGKCELQCKWLTPFLICFTAMILLVCIISMPSLTATLRCVPDHQRAFGLGIQWIVARCLGSIPGPILFGKMFDNACLVWQKRCSGDGSCFFYDNHKLSMYLMALALAFAIAAALLFLLAICLYKVKESDDKTKLKIEGPSKQCSGNSIAPSTNISSDNNLNDSNSYAVPNTSKDTEHGANDRVITTKL